MINKSYMIIGMTTAVAVDENVWAHQICGGKAWVPESENPRAVLRLIPKVGSLASEVPMCLGFARADILEIRS